MFYVTCGSLPVYYLWFAAITGIRHFGRGLDRGRAGEESRAGQRKNRTQNCSF